MLLDPLGDLGQMLVLLPDVVAFGQVDEEDDGLGGQEEEGVDDFDLVRGLSACFHMSDVDWQGSKVLVAIVR